MNTLPFVLTFVLSLIAIATSIATIHYSKRLTRAHKEKLRLAVEREERAVESIVGDGGNPTEALKRIARLNAAIDRLEHG